MRALGSEECATLVKASVLHKAMPDVLAEFEVETLWVLTERALQLGDQAVATLAEWDVVGNAVLGLQAAARKREMTWYVEDGRCRVKLGQEEAPPTAASLRSPLPVKHGAGEGRVNACG